METAVREKLRSVVAESRRIFEAMSTQEVATDPSRYAALAKKHRELSAIADSFTRFEGLEAQLAEAQKVLREESDAEMLELAEEERDTVREQLGELEQQIKFLLVPKDPNDERNTIMEIRAGTGGDEAALFAADLFRMYSRYAEIKGWRVEVMNSNPTELGGYKEISFQISGDAVYSKLKYEGGVHRVQRVPDTETQGRVHTSAVTVAVLPEAEEVDIDLDMNDLQFDVYRSSGPGGQSVNTTDSAVRVTHKPTGLVVTCQDEKSQHKNKAKALRVLRSRLLEIKQSEEAANRSENRKSQVGSGDRSERIRTYNFSQNRLTDHRINLTLYSLDRLMEGDITELTEALSQADRAAKLAAAET
ncbi:MAG: peptide chain release factor 1 [Candidatus Hydrogenedens sp.]|nr:peptide chain release factor 1 [Candidatus Hydrogenedens sp.]